LKNDEIYCEIITVADILRNVILRNNDADDEALQILRQFGQFRAASLLPRCASCDKFMPGFPKKLAVFRARTDPMFGACGVCDTCIADMAPEAIIRAASAAFSEEFAAAAGRA
jgi:hypothetical protein